MNRSVSGQRGGQGPAIVGALPDHSGHSLMAYFEHEIRIRTTPDAAWDALRDVGQLHTRLVAGFVVACEWDGKTRHLRFANGLSAAERIVAVSEAHRRVSWSAQSERLAHHNASAQVLAGDEPSSCRVRWCVDLLPDAMAPAIETMVLAGLQAMRQTLEGL